MEHSKKIRPKVQVSIKPMLTSYLTITLVKENCVTKPRSSTGRTVDGGHYSLWIIDVGVEKKKLLKQHDVFILQLFMSANNSDLHGI